MSTKKLVLKKSAPDEVEVSLGMEFHKVFKRSLEPFSVDTKFADAILRSHDEFAEYQEPAPKMKAAAKKVKAAKKAKKAKAETAGTVQPGAVPNTDPNTHPQEVIETETEQSEPPATKSDSEEKAAG